MDQEDFLDQVRVLRELGEIVRLEEVLSDPGTPDAGPRFAITFDDGYVGALDAAERIWTDFGVPSSVFVCPALIGGGPFWWDSLASARKEGEIPAQIRARCLFELKGNPTRIMETFGTGGIPESPPPRHALPAEESRILELARGGGITFFSHTHAHMNLSALSHPEVRRELERSAEWFRDRDLSESPGFLAYPYGLFSESSMEGARAEGVSFAFTTAGRWIPNGLGHLDPLRVPRINVPAGLRREAFVTLLARATLR